MLGMVQCGDAGRKEEEEGKKMMECYELWGQVAAQVCDTIRLP